MKGKWKAFLMLVGIVLAFILSIWFAILLVSIDSGREEITSIIVNKWDKKIYVVLPGGALIRGYRYYFKMRNGDELSVSYNDYSKYNIGSRYTYWRWKK